MRIVPVRFRIVSFGERIGFRGENLPAAGREADDNRRQEKGYKNAVASWPTQANRGATDWGKNLAQRSLILHCRSLIARLLGHR